jgi:hypothetical protein
MFVFFAPIMISFCLTLPKHGASRVLCGWATQRLLSLTNFEYYEANGVLRELYHAGTTLPLSDLPSLAAAQAWEKQVALRRGNGGRGRGRGRGRG